MCVLCIYSIQYQSATGRGTDEFFSRVRRSRLRAHIRSAACSWHSIIDLHDGQSRRRKTGCATAAILATVGELIQVMYYR